MSDQFKRNVTSYCEIDNNVKSFNKQIKELKNQQKQMSEEIMEYMSSNSLEVCNAGNYGVLTLKSSMVKGTLNKDCIRDNLCKFISGNDLSNQKPEQIAETGAEYILNNRPSELRSSLRRTTTKK